MGEAQDTQAVEVTTTDAPADEVAQDDSDADTASE